METAVACRGSSPRAQSFAIPSDDGGLVDLWAVELNDHCEICNFYNNAATWTILGRSMAQLANLQPVQVLKLPDCSEYQRSFLPLALLAKLCIPLTMTSPSMGGHPCPETDDPCEVDSHAWTCLTRPVDTRASSGSSLRLSTHSTSLHLVPLYSSQPCFLSHRCGNHRGMI